MTPRYEWRVWGRTVHPFTIGVWIAITTVAVYLGVFGEDAQEYVFDAGVLGRLVGLSAGVSSLLFGLGFLFNRWVFLSWGLMLAVWVFVSRAALYALEVGADSFPMWISIGLAFTTAGAWLLERDRHG